MAAFNKIPFAIREADRKIVSIEDVPRGLACACRCPSCDARLQARKGDVNEHHFAHHDSSAELCEFALETSIRLMLLETLGQIQSISTPDFLWGKGRCCSNQGTIPQFGDLFS
ncbi:competence protein CoiA family protein [Pseudaeromonas pectinilytica]